MSPTSSHTAFDREAHNYEQHASIQHETARWCHQWVERDCQGLTALELGAGTGLFTQLLETARFKSLIASDISPEMIRQGRARAPFADWQLLDAWDPPSHLKVDRLYSTSLLQWASQPSSVLRGWNSLLRPGGRALITLFAEGSLCELEELAPGLSPLRWRSHSQWTHEFRTAGFQVVQSESQRRIHHYSTACEALKTLHRTGAVMPNRLTPAALRGLIRRYEQRASCRSGVSMTWELLRMELTTAPAEALRRTT